MALILTMTNSEEELVAGIPAYVTFEVSEPSTVYYTLDGSTPTINSNVFVDKVYLPTSLTTFTIKAIAVSLLETTPVFEQQFSLEFIDVPRSVLSGKEGINILKYSEPVVDNLSYDTDGYSAMETAIPFVDLDMKASTTNKIGEKLDYGPTLDFINLTARSRSHANALVSSVNQENFDPKASVIIIDGSTDEAFDEQVVRILNRSMNSIAPLPSKLNYNNYQLTTSSCVRYMVNPATGKIVFYYFDSRDNRWIKSIQSTDFKPLNISNVSVKKFTYQWVEHRTHTKLF